QRSCVPTRRKGIIRLIDLSDQLLRVSSLMHVGRAGSLEPSLRESSTVFVLQLARCDEEILEFVQQRHLVRQSDYWRAPRDRGIACYPIYRERLSQLLK